jgi:FixJ family two-component response regulator
VARGFTSRQIAEALVISERTAEAHVAQRSRQARASTLASKLAVWASQGKVGARPSG